MSQQGGGGFDALVGKRVACVLTSGERIEGLLSGFDSQFNVSLTKVTTDSVYSTAPPPAGESQAAVPATVVRGTGVMYLEVCE